MKKAIDFYFDFGSPTAYLAWTQLPKIADANNAELHFHPILLGGVFKATGNHSPADIPVKSAWVFKDIQRFSARYGVPYVNNAFFPINTLLLMRSAMGMQLREPGRFLPYLETIYTAIWCKGLDLGNLEIFNQLLLDTGFDPAEIHALTQDPTVKEALRTATEAAIARGVFGVPTMFVGEEMFFGQDRLDFVVEALHSTV